MSVQHTPGRRWYVGAMNDALFIIDEPPRPAPIDYHNDTLKTRVVAKVSEPHEWGWTWAEYKAHADLLAAAPELFDALRKLEAWVTDEMDQAMLGDSVNKREAKRSGRLALLAARAAIERAEKGQP